MATRYEDGHLAYSRAHQTKPYHAKNFAPRPADKGLSEWTHVSNQAGMDQVTTEKYIAKGVPTHATPQTKSNMMALQRQAVSSFKY